ncbi:MAG: extracellular solute-binding protein, partial [Ignavibacteriales bacterium]|nr:extracellular solute-binding protein [Ignavibacteriales bacterium]
NYVLAPEVRRKVTVQGRIARRELFDVLLAILEFPGLTAVRSGDVYKIIPNEADYEIADLLFKDGKAGMIINGDWSWSGYKKAGLDIGIAPLPQISSTQFWCEPMVSPKGFSVNANISEEKKKWAVELVRFLNNEENQLESTKTLFTIPTLKRVQMSAFVQQDEFLRNSQLQVQHGRAMPVVPELRAIWDAMRPSYQAVLSGALDAKSAAAQMQRLAVQRIKDMNE